MKCILFIPGFVCFCLILNTGCFSRTDEYEFPVLKGPYLGQKPPGMIPKIFAPGIICTNSQEGNSLFSSDGSLFLFVRNGSENSGIYIVKQIKGIWTKPELAPFSVGK